MAKKRTVRKSKSRTGRTQHDSEILRAKRAVSAALNEDGSAKVGSTVESVTTFKRRTDEVSKPQRPSPGIPQVMKGLVRVAAGLLARGNRETTENKLSIAAQPSLTAVSFNPLASLAHRHTSGSAKFLGSSAGRSDDIGRQVLANLAKTRLEATLDGSSKQR